jgi:hypothetical protein
MLIFPKMREEDDFGAGHFGARRGGRKHNGIDFAVEAGALCFNLIEGEVTKFGYAYADDLSYRYVQVTDYLGARYRYFYVDPDSSLNIGDKICEGCLLGTAQDISSRYQTADRKMNNHVHFEVIDSDGYFENPADAVYSQSGINLVAKGIVDEPEETE